MHKVIVKSGTVEKKYGATVRMTSGECNMWKNALASYWKYSRQQGEEEEDAAWHSLHREFRSAHVAVRPPHVGKCVSFEVNASQRSAVHPFQHPASLISHWLPGPLSKAVIRWGAECRKRHQSVKTNTLHLFWLTCWGGSGGGTVKGG